MLYVYYGINLMKKQFKIIKRGRCINCGDISNSINIESVDRIYDALFISKYAAESIFDSNNDPQEFDIVDYTCDDCTRILKTLFDNYKHYTKKNIY